MDYSKKGPKSDIKFSSEKSQSSSNSLKSQVTDSKIRRKIVPAPATQLEVQKPGLKDLVEDGLSIIGSELAQYRQKASKGVMLSTREARIVQIYVDTLLKAAKESREQARAEDLSNLSNEELLDLANTLLKRSTEPT